MAQVRPSHNKATAGWGGAAGAALPVRPAGCSAGPGLVRQRDDIVVDARLQLLHLLGCCLGGEDALCLGHGCIRHCCRGEGSVLPLMEGTGSPWLLRAPLHVPHLSPGKGHKATLPMWGSSREPSSG